MRNQSSGHPAANQCPGTGDDPLQSGFHLLSSQTTGDDGGVLRSFCEQVLNNHPITIHGDSRQSEADSMAARTDLGYEPTVSLREGPTDRPQLGLAYGAKQTPLSLIALSTRLSGADRPRAARWSPARLSPRVLPATTRRRQDPNGNPRTAPCQMPVRTAVRE